MPIDAVALAVIAIVIVVSRWSLVHRGMTWNDPSWYFHFGRRLLHGDVPYRDYVFQVGPLPIFVDAAFQKLFGSTYASSVDAALLLEVLRVWVAWLIIRRLVPWWCAALACTFCAFDLAFGQWAHHWSWGYAQLFIALAGLCFLLASRAAGRRALVYLALAGLCAGLVVASRQATVVMIALLLAVASVALLVRREYLTRSRLVALWAGFAAAFVLVFGALALVGAARAGFQQMFLDAPQKKDISGVTAVLEAVTGGATTIWNLPWWVGLLRLLAWPSVLVAIALWLTTRDRTISSRTLALLVVPIAMLVGLCTRYAGLDLDNATLRTMLTATTALAIVFPERTRRWLGIEPIVAIGFGGLALMSDYALGMSYPGPGWDDEAAMILALLVMTLASTRVGVRAKAALCALLAVAGLWFVVGWLQADMDPFAKPEASDGLLHETTFESGNPLLAGTAMSEPRVRALAWLERVVPRGSTCFVYGTQAVLYDLLDCTNPTLIDVTIPDFLTAADAERAIAALQAHPPEFLLAHEHSFMNPSISVDYEGKIASYSELNSKASYVLWRGLHAMLPQYESLGTVGEAIGPKLAALSVTWMHWDAIAEMRVYRRKR
ncbi:MAG TPA: glycosyltransferase family 39 protein [Kofleriaceae bacterium]|nr:glycosyltransferase family 39 protein [Kofleriaceae bacterium]